MFRFLILCSFCVFFNTLVFAQDAIYSLEFISNWNNTTHPTNYPGAAHWSRLIGATHNSNISFWKLGELASEGVEEVAENGNIAVVEQEIIAEMANGNAYAVINFPLSVGGPFPFDSTIFFFQSAINVDSHFPYISLMTMIAPSPDWLGEINSLKLTDASGNWLSSISVDVYATDSGTDNGPTYISTDEDSVPHVTMYSLQNTFPFSDQIIATFVLTLDQVLAIEDNQLQNTISISPNPSKGEVFIHNSGNSILESAEIYAITGKKVKVFNNITNKERLVLNSLQPGMYFLKLNSDRGRITKKLIIR